MAYDEYGQWQPDEPAAPEDEYLGGRQQSNRPAAPAQPPAPAAPTTVDRTGATPAPPSTAPKSTTEPVPIGGGRGPAYPPQPTITTLPPQPTSSTRGAQDAFFQTLVGGGFSPGAAPRGPGFFSGGNAYRNNLQPIVDAFNKAHPGANARAVGDDKIDFGDGRGPQDVITAQGDFWYGGGPADAGEGAGSAGSSGVTAPSAGTGSYSSDPALNDAIHANLLKMLTQGDPTEQDVMSQYAPVARTFQRGAERAKLANSERLAFEGLNAGGSSPQLEAANNQTNEQLTESQGGLMAQLIGHELDARRQQLVDALQYAQGEERIQLQLQIAQLDAQMRKYGIDVQNSQFGQSLSQQNNQFYDNIDYNKTRDKYIFDQMYAHDLLGA